MNRRPNTRGNADEKSWTYPKHVSDRADTLIDELDERQILRLYNVLKTKTYLKWLGWFSGAREKIAVYDALSHPERQTLLQNTDQDEPLLLHHACVFAELLRSRIERKYSCFPPSGDPLDTQYAQRRMVLDVLDAYEKQDQRDWWPFDLQDIEDPYPFQRDD